jgi:multidrug resistance protein, MATE family
MAMQFFDALGARAHGLLRGIRSQFIGVPVNGFIYYLISLPISVALAFKLDWKLEGLWNGTMIGLML